MTVIDTAEKLLSPGLFSRVAPVLQRLETILFSRDGQAAAQRMALIAFSIRILSAAIAFASQVLLARIMGEFEYGIFVFVWVLAIILGNLSCLGFHTTVIRFLPQYRDSGANDAVRGLASTARIFALISATTIAGLGIACLFLFSEHIESYYVVPLYLGAFALPMIALGDVLEGTARANNWPIQALSPTYIIRPILIILGIYVALAFGLETSAQTALIAALVAAYLTTVCQFTLMVRRLDRHYQRGPLSIEIKTWLTVALPIFLIEGFYFLLTNADVIIVGFYLEPDQVAIYFAAAKTMALVHFVYFAVKAAAAPRISSLVGSANTDELAKFVSDTTRWVFWPSLVFGGAVLAAGPLLLSLFGEAFTAGHMVMAILFTGMMAKALVGPGEVLLTMAGEQRICVVVYACAFATNVVCNVILIPIYGIYGAAIATMAAMAVEATGLHLLVRQRLSINMFAFVGRERAGLVAKGVKDA